MKYFTLQEFTNSNSAKKLNIDNTPETWQINNINEFVDNLLDPLREDWGKYCTSNNLGSPGIFVNSGVRSFALNDAVGGSKTSSHIFGLAADISPVNGKMVEFKNFCIKWLDGKKFDQFISESENANGVPQWIHLGYKKYNGEQRRQFLKMINGMYYQL